MKIGFIGLGNMGGPMALNLMKAGHELLVHDVRRETAAVHLDKGARWAASPRDAAVDRELILTSLPGPAEVERVATGGDGVIHGAARGAIYTDLSTGSPTVMRKLHGVFKERGVHVLDAPVSGGVPGAVHGTLQVMVGGDEAIYQRAKPALEAIGKVGYMGSIGAGTIAKLVHNAISLSTRAIVAEAFTLGVKAGVRPEALLEAVRGGSFGQGNILSRVRAQRGVHGRLRHAAVRPAPRQEGRRARDRAGSGIRRAHGPDLARRAIDGGGGGARMGRAGLQCVLGAPGGARRGQGARVQVSFALDGVRVRERRAPRPRDVQPERGSRARWRRAQTAR